MRTLKSLVIGLLCVMALASCSDSETYADQKKKERSAINAYIAKNKINVIKEEQFFAQDSMTDVSKNEYVLFNSSGVYLQIVRKGCGKKLQNQETATVLCRFTERNLLTDTIQLSNDNLTYATLVDKMSVKKSSGTFSASCVTDSSLMYMAYSSAAVPKGWLVPLAYINIGRPASEDEQIAKVKLIVPHTQGQQYASQSVYPCMYELTYQRGR